MSEAVPITAYCTFCKRAWVRVNPNWRKCGFAGDDGRVVIPGCGGPVADLPEPVPNDCYHVRDKYFLRDEFIPVDKSLTPRGES